MWVVLARQPRPLARVWVGRVPLAIADALAWPTAWIYLVLQLPIDSGLFGRASVAVALLLAAHRSWIATWHNERYNFMTWRLWGWAWPLLALAIALQVAFWLVR